MKIKKDFLFWVIVLLIALLGIPICLNYILRIHVQTPVVGGEDSELVWLAFWGAYLSAIGSFVMAWVSYQNNRLNAERSYKASEIHCKEASLRTLKELIISNEDVHSISMAIEVYHKAEKSVLEGIQSNLVWLKQLKDTPTHFNEVKSMSSPGYDSALKSASFFFSEMNGRIQKILISSENDDSTSNAPLPQARLQLLSATLNESYKIASQLTSCLMDEGFQLLLRLYSELSNQKMELNKEPD